MDGLMRLLLGNTAGAVSSEARVSLAGLAGAVGLYLTGQPVQAVHLAMTTIAGYAASRGVAKAGEAVGKMVQEREVRAALRGIATPVMVVGSDIPGAVVPTTEAPAVAPGAAPGPDELTALVSRLSPDQLRALLTGLRKS